MAMQIQNGVNYKKSSSNNNVNPFLKTFIVQSSENKNAPKINTTTRTKRRLRHPYRHPIWPRGKLICFNGLGLSGL